MSPLARLIAGAAVLVIVYFTVPVRVDANLTVRAVLTVIGIAVAAALIVRQVRRQLTGTDSPLWGLALALVGGVLVFALTDYLIAVSQPGQFSDLRTRLDALYFALTTLATVGYGDIHAKGQLARAAVSLQLVFNLLVLTTAASLLLRQMRVRGGKRSAGQ